METKSVVTTGGALGVPTNGAPRTILDLTVEELASLVERNGGYLFPDTRLEEDVMQDAKPPPDILWTGLVFMGYTFRLIRRGWEPEAQILDGADYRDIVRGSAETPCELPRPAQAFVAFCVAEFRRRGELPWGLKPDSAGEP